MNPNEEVGYRSPINVGPASEPDKDVDNFSTLEDVSKKFNTELENLYTDFNAFGILKGESKEKAAEVLLRQVEAKQEAYKILEPLARQLQSAVDDINNKAKGA